MAELVKAYGTAALYITIYLYMCDSCKSTEIYKGGSGTTDRARMQCVLNVPTTRRSTISLHEMLA